MIRIVHPVAGALALALATIATFWLSTALSELFASQSAVVAVKTAIPWGFLVLVPALAATGGSGFALAAGRLAGLWLVGFAFFYGLMRGGVFGLSVVSEASWGGLSLTIFIFVATVLLGMPTAIVLALLRRSTMPVIASAAALVIDCVRSLPLLSILFTAAVIVPFLMPQGMSGDKLYRVIAGCAIFFAAYQAEVIRSGMQAVGRGQEEAATALGLGYWHHVGYILMPQAFRYALPPTISQIVIAFKETSLVVIVGFFELMASANAAYGTGEWRFAYVEVYVFVAILYFVFIFSLSRYGAYLERNMRVGKI